MTDVIEATARESEPEDDGGFTEAAERVPAVPALAERNEAVAAAADAVLAMPGVAGRDEFLSLCMQARILSMSGAAPPEIRGNPYVAFHVAMVGRDLGLSPSAAIELIDVIPGKNGPQLSLSPQLMNAQAHRVYGGEIVKAYSEADSCTAVAIGPGGRDPRCRRAWPTTGRREDEPLHWPDKTPAAEPDSVCSCDVIGEATFTWEDARIAGLAGPNCRPGVHVKDQSRSSGDRSWKVCGCNQGYITYPQRMMWQRSCGFAADDYFPGAGLGLYTPEALGATVDEEGRPIDPATVALPEGYEPEPKPLPQAEAPVDPDELWDLQARLHALPEKQQREWLERKSKNPRLAGQPTATLPAGLVRLASSMLRGLEAAAKRETGVDPAEAAEMVKIQCAAKVIALLSVSPETGEEPSPEPEPKEIPEEPEPTPEPGPTTGDVTALHAEIAEIVDGMKVGDVRKDLRDFGLSGEGPVPIVRARLVHKMAAERLGTEEAT